MEVTCPTCGSLLYSRRSKLCGECGAMVPRELQLTDDDVEAMQKERQWARDLAGKFGTTGCQSKTTALDSPHARYEAAEANPEELLRRVSCAAEFKHRKRKWFWVFLPIQICVLFGVFILGVAALGTVRGLPWGAFLVLLGFFAVSSYVLWLRSDPICPNCQQNIRTCRTHHCHICGKQISRNRCSNCNVDYTWTGCFNPFGNGRNLWIKYCPDCGVELDTCIPHRRDRSG
jgi:hypothetical protein